MTLAEQQRLFDQWMRELGAIVHHVVNGFAAGEDRKDLLQHVLVSVWKAIPAFRGQAKPSTYLYRISHNAALLWVRTEKNYRRRIEQFAAYPELSHADGWEQGGDDRLARLYAQIHALRPVDRSLMLLLLDGLSYREMAEILGLSESAVGTRINRIKTQLTQSLKGTEQ